MTVPADDINSASTPDRAAPQRARGPHPLPLFLALAAQATRADTARLARVLAGVRAYQAHDHVRQLAPMPPLARLGGVTLRDYGGDGTPLMVVPSLINPPHVLDLAEDNSLLRWLATQGLRPLLVDWGSPGADERTLDAAGYVSERLLPLIAGLPVPPLMLGYCLGGTLAIAAAALAPVRRLALIAAPWRFAAYDPAARDGIAALWASVGPAATTLGCMPVELLQPAFWQLDPAALVAKYEQFPRLDAAAAAAYAVLEDWEYRSAARTRRRPRPVRMVRRRPSRSRRMAGGRPADRPRAAWLRGPRHRLDPRPHRSRSRRLQLRRPARARPRACRHGRRWPGPRAALGTASGVAQRRLERP